MPYERGKYNQQRNLQGNVTVQGTDEITQLASGLEHMRQTLVKKRANEIDLKSALGEAGVRNVT